MGVIADAINNFDKSGAEKEAIKNELDLLSALAMTKAELADQTIRRELLDSNSSTSQLIPITKIRESTFETHAFASSNAGQITDTVGKSVNAFLKGGQENIVNGIIDLVSQGITVFLGGGAGTEDLYKKMFIVGMGEHSVSMVRFDVWGWRREVMGQGVKEKVERVSAFVGIKSIVDFTRLDFPTFVNLYNEQLQSSGLGGEDIISALKHAREVYKMMTGDNFAALEAAPVEAAIDQKVEIFDLGFDPRY